ncbi:hypothetical protein N7495_007130, partial [Penicillium taxi]|uniref:uncharacterized protein n=1 Tax=Penicillium taxi TaxID=168475 RepID=UPI002545219C
MVLFTIVATNVNPTLRKRYLHVILHKRIEFHETTFSSGSVTLALSNHANTIRSGLAEKFGLSLKSASTVVSGFVVALHSEWRLGLVTATIIPAAVILIGITSAYDENKEQEANIVNAEAATLAGEVLGSMRTVRALNAANKISRKYKLLLEKAVDIGCSRAPFKGAQAGIYMLAIYAAYALAFWYGMRLYAGHKVISSGVVITTLFSIMIVINSFSELAGYLGAFLRIRSAGVQLFKVIDLASDNCQERAVDHSEEASEIFHQDIQFKKVSFEYPTRQSVKVPENLSLHILAGKTTALGSISLTEHNMNDLPLEILRANIGLVQQEPYLFSGTVFENISYGLIRTSMNDLLETKKRELVIEACKISNAHEFIMGLPKGYNTHLGNRGSLLSGGQKQRLAIARAIVKNPPILILDEATSALDVESEYLIQQGLENARKHRTTICIAYRLTTIESADQIIVMKKGTVIESGTHADLMHSDRIYKQLWDSQAIIQNEKAETIEEPKSFEHVYQHQATEDENFRIPDPETNMKLSKISA